MGAQGPVPGDSRSSQYGEAARELYGHAKALLDRIIREKLLTARAVYAFWPANTDGDDVVVFKDDSRGTPLARLPMLRQQEVQPDTRPNLSLADFVAPHESGVPDYLGMFAVTAGIGADVLVRHFEQDHDDYNAIMVKALADRLAEASAEYLHAQARKDWGYGEQEQLSTDDLIAEKFRGIRPAYGYPACPDHSEKFKLFDLLDAGKQGIILTEHAAMLPAASVSGLYFANPRAKYFNVGRLGRDQIESYAKRKGAPLEAVERWLGRRSLTIRVCSDGGDRDLLGSRVHEVHGFTGSREVQGSRVQGSGSRVQEFIGRSARIIHVPARWRLAFAGVEVFQERVLAPIARVVGAAVSGRASIR